MYCKHCGTIIDDDSAFCFSCGGKQHSSAAAATTPVQPVVSAPATPAPTAPATVTTAPVTPTPAAPTTVTAAPVTPAAAAPTPTASINEGAAGVGFVEAIRRLYVRAFDFNGRATRSEYWFAVLYNMLTGTIIGFIPVVGMLWSLVHFIPGLSLSIRRLHDVGHSASVYWFYLFLSIVTSLSSLGLLFYPEEWLWLCLILVFFILLSISCVWLLVQLCRDSEGDNEWGPNPYAAAKSATPRPSVSVSSVGHRWRCSCGQLIASSPCPYCGTQYLDNGEENELRQRLEEELRDPSLEYDVAILYRRYLQVMYTEDGNAPEKWEMVLNSCDDLEDTEIVLAIRTQSIRQMGKIGFCRCVGCGKVLPNTQRICPDCGCRLN